MPELIVSPRYTSLESLQADLRSGKTTCVREAAYYLQRIEDTRQLNTYTTVFAEEILAKAAQLDDKIKNSPEKLGKLFGAIVAIKDVICYAGHKVTASSKILGDFHSLFSATAVERILAEDALIIGVTNCDEFAMGSSNENSRYGAVGNGYAPQLVPGGSSGGAAVAVQTDTCLVSLGTDTGGSVRQPAGFCGVFGLKPTYGRISRHGLIAYGSSFDQLGILSHSISDAALFLEVMAGADDHDSTSAHQEVPAYSRQLTPPAAVRLCYFKEAVEHPGIDAAIKANFLQTIEKLRNEGHVVDPIGFPYLDYIIPAYYVLTTAEASSNLARYDGVRFGYRHPGAKNLRETYLQSRTQGFGAEVKRRILLGTFVLSSGYYDAYYTKAQQVRRLIAATTKAIFDDYHYILLPASPVLPWSIGDKVDDPVAMYLADIFTVHANMAGIPAICVPTGFTDKGLPVGTQLMAAPFHEAQLLAFASQL